MKLLFITWDGPGTMYHETLFIPLLERSLAPGDSLDLLQFSWASEERVRRLSSFLRDRDIGFEHRNIRRGFGTFGAPFTLLRALAWIVRRSRCGEVDTVMARSMIPGALGVAWSFITGRHCRFIFDADGLPADERVEFGRWRRMGPRYLCYRLLERLSIRNADAILVRTSRAAAILSRRASCDPERFIVLVNGKNADEFRPTSTDERVTTRANFGLRSDRPVLAYVGSLGPQYEPEFLLEVHAATARRIPGAQLLLLTPHANHDDLLRMANDRLKHSIVLLQADPCDVPALLAAADVGLALRRPAFSQSAVAPIKVAEYLLSGLPVVYSQGIGDLDGQLHPGVGLATTGTDPTEAERIASWIADVALPGREEFGVRARQLGLSQFSLEVGAAGYREAYARCEAR